ncbi:MAG: sulfatase-like hydrolase/transferase [Verrucomicrobiales bacterium]
MKRIPLAAAISLAAALSLAAGIARAAEKNVIFIITDDESPTLGCYGDAAAATPAIDALDADGTLFRNAFATTAKHQREPLGRDVRDTQSQERAMQAPPLPQVRFVLTM